MLSVGRPWSLLAIVQGRGAVVISPGPCKEEGKSDFPSVPKAGSAPNLELGCAYESLERQETSPIGSSPSVSGRLALGQMDAVLSFIQRGNETAHLGGTEQGGGTRTMMNPSHSK